MTIIMKMGFWSKLKKPFFVLAPMADVTDTAFREIIAKYGKTGGGAPDVFWTEFVSADGLVNEKAYEKLKRDLEFTEEERPIVAQIFGSKEKNMEDAASIISGLGFDGVDINMGCPDRSIEKQGSGAAHIKDIKHSLEIIKAVQRGAHNIPVSVKTRVGYNSNQIEQWIPRILETGISALIVHARTRKDMSLIPANWDYIKRVVEIRDMMGVETLIIGNGDVVDLNDAKAKAKYSGADGVMLGRAVFGNPWLFNKSNLKDIKQNNISTQSDGLKCDITGRTKNEKLIEHSKLFDKKLGDIKNFAIMRKHYKAYANGFDGAKKLRMELMKSKNAKDTELIVKSFLSKKHNEF